jgi:hypothetical protein
VTKHPHPKLTKGPHILRDNFYLINTSMEKGTGLVCMSRRTPTYSGSLSAAFLMHPCLCFSLDANFLPSLS